jgi:hypothetical protein
VILIFTLIQHPEGVAGAIYKRLHPRRRPEAPSSRSTPSLSTQRASASAAVER